MPDSSAINHSVIKAFRLLDAFNHDHPEWGVSELSREMGVNKSTVYRLLNTLESLGAVKQNPYTERYSLGFKLYDLGQRILPEPIIAEYFRPFLSDISQNILETVQLVALYDNKALIIDQVVSPKGLHLNNRVGSALPLHATAPGKVLLAGNTHLFSILTELPSFTPKTKTLKMELENDLRIIQRNSFCLEKEEHEQGLVSLAVPIQNHSGRVIASVCVSGPAGRFKEHLLEEYLKIIRESTQAIEKLIQEINLEKIF